MPVDELKTQVQDVRAKQTAELEALQASLPAQIDQSTSAATSQLAAQLAQVQATLAELCAAGVSDGERQALDETMERERRVYQEGLEANRRAADEVRAALDKVHKEQMAGAMVPATELGELQKQLAQLREAQVASGGEATAHASERNNETRERLRLEAALAAQAEETRRVREQMEAQQRELMRRLDELERSRRIGVVDPDAQASLRAASAADDELRRLREDARLQAERQRDLEARLERLSGASSRRDDDDKERVIAEMKAQQDAANAKLEALKEILVKIQIDGGGRGGGGGGGDGDGDGKGKKDKEKPKPKEKPKKEEPKEEPPEPESDEEEPPEPSDEEEPPEPSSEEDDDSSEEEDDSDDDDAPPPPPPPKPDKPAGGGGGPQKPRKERLRFEEMLDNRAMYSEADMLSEAEKLFTDGDW